MAMKWPDLVCQRVKEGLSLFHDFEQLKQTKLDLLQKSHSGCGCAEEAWKSSLAVGSAMSSGRSIPMSSRRGMPTPI